MKSEAYLKALQYFSENSIHVSKDQLKLLEDKINTSEENGDYEKVYTESELLEALATDVIDNYEDYKPEEHLFD